MSQAGQATLARLDTPAAMGRPSAEGAGLGLLHVFPSFGLGGAQARFAILAHALGGGFRHTVVCLNDDRQAAALLSPAAPVAFAEAPPAEGALPARLAVYRRMLRDLRPDLLLTYNWGSIEVALANFGRIPHLHVEDGFGPEEARRQFRRRVWLRRLALARSQVVVPSLTLQEIALKTWRLRADQVHYVPNGVASASACATRLEAIAPGLPAGAVRIAWAGGLRREKNLMRLLRAFAPVKDNAVLLLIGDGPEKPAVLAEAERLALGPRLRVLGPRADVRDLLMQSDILALSSDTEQMPLVVLEAMDAGLPVAACDVGDIHHIVAPENWPYLVAPDDQALAASLAALTAMPEMRRTIGEANRARARRVFSDTRMIDSYRTLFLGAGGRSATPPSAGPRAGRSRQGGP
jgi:glycosyltransferase involved in cell wall biosynthesis